MRNSKRSIQKIIFSAVILTAIISCNKLAPSENIPAYIKINGITLRSDTNKQHTLSNKITDSWVYLDDQALGAYQNPCTFPIITTPGMHSIKIGAGIKLDGIAATRVIYNFYTLFDTVVNLSPKTITTISPWTRYASYTNFLWIENFEQSGISLSNTNSDTVIQTTNLSTPANVFEGAHSGAAYLDATHPYFECRSFNSFNLPQGGAAVFLELNYKSNNLFNVGIYDNNFNQMYSLSINPSPVWNKIYVNLTNQVSGGGAPPFIIFINMTKDPNVPYPQLFLDNIELVD
ncbi:MAG: hypothetical protein ABI199_02735 [Bacteroidia bacterium]